MLVFLCLCLYLFHFLLSFNINQKSKIKTNNKKMFSLSLSLSLSLSVWHLFLFLLSFQMQVHDLLLVDFLFWQQSIPARSVKATAPRNDDVESKPLNLRQSLFPSYHDPSRYGSWMEFVPPQAAEPNRSLVYVCIFLFLLSLFNLLLFLSL